MKYDFRKQNLEPHLDIERDLAIKKNGLFTFTLRVNNGKVVDYSLVEQIDVKTKYLRLKRVIIERIE